MIVVMKPKATPQQVEHVKQLVQEMGLTSHVIVGTERTVVAAVGDKRGVDKSFLENTEGVEKIVPILAPYKIASRETKTEPSEVEIRPGVRIGGKNVGVVAGPCTVESRDGLLRIAEAVKAAGAIGLRGGAFKPRTSPYSFQGLGEEGLKYLAEVREQTGLAIVTEVMAVDKVEMVAAYADVLQIGARNMQNYNLLQAVGQQGKPVMLKRGMSATLEEFLLAAEYIISQGNRNVILCERGIRTFEQYVRNTLPLAVVPELKRVSHLPVVVDPSHGTGHAYLVPAMCRAAVAAGADGLIIEVHDDPEHAVSDGAQSITPEAFAEVMGECAKIAQAIGRLL
ncbi:MAG: Phospho-2-dehydro-3-deoxyheptonate aldolase [Phycisphaerae bacterium]|nr:Phospho-2-dehydro-3-deoxyheptonate aldolase [Phycisphaerae bacterium]